MKTAAQVIEPDSSGEDKNKRDDIKEQITTLEQEMKSSFKEGDYDAMRAKADKLRALDTGNRLVEKLMKKAEKVKEKKGKKVKQQKAKEYKTMLKTLLKEQDAEKLIALAKEFKDFDPENKHADKWVLRAERLKKKLNGRKEESLKIEAKPEPVKSAFSMPLKPVTAKPTPTAKITMPKVPVTPVAKTAPAAEPVKSAMPKTETPAKPKGNLFTKIFGKKDEVTNKKSIIDTIVAKTNKKKEMKTPEKKMEFGKPQKKKDSMKMLTFSKVFMNFTIIFIVFSAAFLYVEWIDQTNTVLGLAGISENTGKKLHSASEKLTSLKSQETKLNKDIELFKGGYDDEAVSIVDTIIKERINWPDIFAKINEVTNSVYELNDFFKYIEYNNYSFDAENRTIRVSGTLTDPLGRNLTKLVELEEAFKYYPADRNNPDDKTKPYFTGFKEFTSFSKTLDADTGRYNSSFQLSFSLNE